MTKDKSEAKQKSKEHLKVMSSSRRHRARSTRRVIKYGASSFARNLWLTIAATLVMTIALLVISVTLIARNVMMDTVDKIKNDMDISVFLAQSTPEEDITTLISSIERLDNVRDGGVWSISPEQAKAELGQMKSDDQAVQDALEIANNKFLWTIHIRLIDINDLSELDHFLNSDPLIQQYQVEDADLEKTKRDAVTKIGSTANFVESIGLIAGGIFVVIAALIIFNTIRMAIFNRREEIEMMKLIGAEKSFIRGPFLVEATFYGIIAATVTAGVVWAALTLLLTDKLESYGLVVRPTTELILDYWWITIPSLLLTGILIGVFSAFIATKKYLRLK